MRPNNLPRIIFEKKLVNGLHMGHTAEQLPEIDGCTLIGACSTKMWMGPELLPAYVYGITDAALDQLRQTYGLYTWVK